MCHQSLSLKPDDTFTCEMLSEALKDTLDVSDVNELGGSSSAGPSRASSAMDLF